MRDRRSSAHCANTASRAGSCRRSGSGCTPADANRRGDDYSGKGVHVAARVAALAGGGEIVVSAAETLAEAGDVPTRDARTVTVKGVTEPVDIAAVVWAD